MNVKIVVDDNKFLDNNLVQVVQRNKNPGEYNKFCEHINGKILVSVPTCQSSAEYQLSDATWKNLVGAFSSCIKKSLTINKNGIIIPELGKDLLWKKELIVKAAKESLYDVTDDCPNEY